MLAVLPSRPARSGRRTATPCRVVRVVTGIALAGMLVACGSDTAGDPSPTPVGPTDTASPTSTPETPTTRPADPVPSPTRGDITPTEATGTGALPPEVLPSPLPTLRPADPGRSPELEAAADAAVRDLGTRLDVDPASIEVLVARSETFPDGAIGCPQPGQVVTQALVDGHRIVLVRGDRAWLYTAAEGQTPELCPSDAADGGHGWVPPPGFDE